MTYKWNTRRLLLSFSFSLYFLELTNEVSPYLQMYQIDSDDDNIRYHPFLRSSVYQNSLKNLFDVFSSPPFTTVPSPALLSWSHSSRAAPWLPHQRRAPSGQVLTIISDLSAAVTSDGASPTKSTLSFWFQKSALIGFFLTWLLLLGHLCWFLSPLSPNCPRAQSLDLFYINTYFYLCIDSLFFIWLSLESVKNEKAVQAVVDRIMPPQPLQRCPQPNPQNL